MSLIPRAFRLAGSGGRDPCLVVALRLERQGWRPNFVARAPRLQRVKTERAHCGAGALAREPGYWGELSAGEFFSLGALIFCG